jgi:hypothetical protein
LFVFGERLSLQTLTVVFFWLSQAVVFSNTTVVFQLVTVVLHITMVARAGKGGGGQVPCEYLWSGWGYCHLGNLSTIPNNTIVFSNTTA